MSLFQLRQTFLLLITALIWGCSFVAQSVGMDHVGPFTFTASRMFLGAIVLTPLVLWMNHKEPIFSQGPNGIKTAISGGLLCALLLFLGESLQQFGLIHDTSVGKAGFITSLYIVLVPILGLFLGHRCGRFVWIGVVMSLIGLYFLCITEAFSISLGDTYMFFGALTFSLHILVIAHFITKMNGIVLSWLQFIFGSIIATTAMLIFESPTLASIQSAALPILWAGIMSNGIAYTLQIVGQRGMNSTVASLIMSLESAFAAIAGWLLLNEVLSQREITGCLLMGAAIILAQLGNTNSKASQTKESMTP